MWISVKQYAKLKKLKSPQVVYYWIKSGKLKKDIDWIEETKTVTHKKIKI